MSAIIETIKLLLAHKLLGRARYDPINHVLCVISGKVPSSLFSLLSLGICFSWYRELVHI